MLCRRFLQPVAYEHLYSPKQATKQTENRLYTQENKSTHNNKITEMNTNIKHSTERLTRHYERQQIYDKIQI